jgi:hypothetical protein
MLGDQLYFARDELGIYAVNWCIKDHVTDFVNAFKMRGNKERAKSNEAHQARLLIEFEVFRDAGIKTVQVSSDDIPFHLRHNLRLIYPWCERSHGLLESMSRDFIETLIERIPKNVPVIETMKKFSINHGGTLYDYSTCFYQAVWQRQIRCDLLRPLAIDMPLKPTTKKIEESFSTWCSRINQ